MGGGGGGVLAGGDAVGGSLGLFLVQAIIVIMLTRLLAVGLQYVHQPRVIAEVIGGILLGPSFLGSLLPGFTATVFPRSSLPLLTLVANLGLILYLFLVGIELDPRTMVANINKTFLIASFGIATPFALGWLLAPYLYREVMQPSLPPGAKPSIAMSSFAVFICVAISITAFPVLARIMNETKLLRTRVGITALGAAALDDVTAWSLLALSFALIHASEPAVAAWIIMAVTAYAVFVLGVVRPLWWTIVDRVAETGSHTLQSRLLALTFVLLFASAWATEALGVHAIFGGFLLGLIMPRGHAFTMAITEKLEDIVQIVFLPLYFAASGLKTDINSLKGARSVGLLALVLTVSCLAKLLGCGLGARLTGLGWRESLTVGVLMNTRGLVELIVLNMGLEAKVINVELFTIMVLVALLTTFMTTPMVALIYPPRYRTLAPLSPSPHHLMLTTAAARQDLGRTSEATSKQQPTSSSSQQRALPIAPFSSPTFRLVLVLERLEEMPALTNLLYLLKPPPPPTTAEDEGEDDKKKKKNKGKEGGQQAAQQQGEGLLPFIARSFSSSSMASSSAAVTAAPLLSLTALHFSDASSACSDMLRATMPDVAKSADPTLYMIKMFGELVGASVSTESIVGPPNHFAAHLTSRARGADLTILPYNEQRRADAVLGDYHEKFVQSAIAKANSPIGVLLNPRSGQFHGLTDDAREVLLIVTGQGPNDREAVQVGRRLQLGRGRGRGLHLDVLVLMDEEESGQGEGEEAKDNHDHIGSSKKKKNKSNKVLTEDEEEVEEEAKDMEEGAVSTTGHKKQDNNKQQEKEEEAVGGGSSTMENSSNMKEKTHQQQKNALLLEELEQLGAREIVQLAPPPPQSSSNPSSSSSSALCLLRQRALRRPYEFIIFGAGKLPPGWDPQHHHHQHHHSSSTPPPPLFSHHDSSHPTTSSSPLPPRLASGAPHLLHHHNPHHHHLQPQAPHRSLSPLTAMSASPRLSRRASLLGGSSMVARALAEVKAPLLVLHAPAAANATASSTSTGGALDFASIDDSGGSGLGSSQGSGSSRRSYQSYAQALLTGGHHGSSKHHQPQSHLQHEAPPLPPRPTPRVPSPLIHLEGVVPSAV